MPNTLQLPPEIQEFLDRGVLRRITETEFVIDALRHRTRTWLGWSTVVYDLRIEEGDDGVPIFEIVEQTESLGEDVLVSDEDPDEAVCWIEEALSEFEAGAA